MSTEEKDIEFIKRYLHFELSEEELTSFDQRVNTDPEFASKVMRYQDSDHIVTKAFKTPSQKERSEQWKTMLHPEKDHSKTKNISWRWLGSVAAVVLALFGLWQLLDTSQKPDIAKLIEASWNKKIGLDYNKVRGNDQDTITQLIRSAFDHYEDNQYATSLAALKHFSSTSASYEDALLLRGLSLYQSENTDAALKTLDTLSQYPSGKKSQVARWYIGLIHLEQGNMDAASKFLIIPTTTNKEIKLKEK